MTQQTFYRAVPAALDMGAPRADGRRQLTGRLMPYDTPAYVLDEFDGKLDVYQEGFVRGAFDGQVLNSKTNKGVLSRIGLIHRHEGGLGYLGPFTALREEPDGLYGDALILPTKAEDVEALLDAGVDELSIEFRLRSAKAPDRNTYIDDNGVRWRTKVHLDQVALEPKGAYSTAQVLQFRNEMDQLAQEEAELQAESEEADAEMVRAREAADEIARQAEIAATEALERKRRWNELAERAAAVTEAQQQLERQFFGVSQSEREHIRKGG